MAEPFLSEIRMMSFIFAPKGWALCNGQLLPINQNQALFSLLGTTFGGDGRVNFGLPDYAAACRCMSAAAIRWASAAASRRTRFRSRNAQHTHTCSCIDAPTPNGNSVSRATTCLLRPEPSMRRPPTTDVALNAQ